MAVEDRLALLHRSSYVFSQVPSPQLLLHLSIGPVHSFDDCFNLAPVPQVPFEGLCNQSIGLQPGTLTLLQVAHDLGNVGEAFPTEDRGQGTFGSGKSLWVRVDEDWCVNCGTPNVQFFYWRGGVSAPCFWGRSWSWLGSWGFELCCGCCHGWIGEKWLVNSHTSNWCF